MNGFKFNKRFLSQIPALHQLINLVYRYLLPSEALAQRQGKAGNVLLENIFCGQLYHRRAKSMQACRLDQTAARFFSAIRSPNAQAK